MDKSQKEKYFIALGEISAYTNLLERHIFKFIQSIGKFDKATSYFIFAGEDQKLLLKILDVIIRLRITDPAAISPYERIRGKISEIFEKRNGYLHAVWLFKGDGDEAIRSKMPRKQLGEFSMPIEEPVPLDELNEYISEIIDATFALVGFCIKQFPDEANEKTQDTKTENDSQA
ncbi:MAG: hypothetical protein WBZ48_02495 [Bacteroidota bacterium]